MLELKVYPLKNAREEGGILQPLRIFHIAFASVPRQATLNFLELPEAAGRGQKTDYSVIWQVALSISMQTSVPMACHSSLSASTVSVTSV